MLDFGKFADDVIRDSTRELQKETLKMWYIIRDQNRLKIEEKEWSNTAERDRMVRRAAEAQAEIDILLMKIGKQYDV